MYRLSALAGGALALACGVSLAAQQLAPPSAAGRSTLAAAPQPRVSIESQELLRGTRGNVLTMIQGNALTATNAALPDAIVRLRDARYGHIIDTQVTDKAGLFAFRTIDPGTYVVELMGNDRTVLAASELLNVASGDVVSAIVKMPWRVPPAGGLLGSTRGSALIITAAAASAGVLATAVANRPVSGER